MQMSSLAMTPGPVMAKRIPPPSAPVWTTTTSGPSWMLTRCAFILPTGLSAAFRGSPLRERARFLPSPVPYGFRVLRRSVTLTLAGETGSIPGFPGRPAGTVGLRGLGGDIVCGVFRVLLAWLASCFLVSAISGRGL